MTYSRWPAVFTILYARLTAQRGNSRGQSPYDMGLLQYMVMGHDFAGRGVASAGQ